MKTFWILKTPGGEFIEQDEPMNYDWKVCKKYKVVNGEVFDEVLENFLKPIKKFIKQ